jgi:hypothetical protein
MMGTAPDQNNTNLTTAFNTGLLILGVLTALSLAVYALANIVAMPAVSPDGFVPQSASASSGGHSLWLGTAVIISVLVYAFAFLPVTVMFTIRKYAVNPVAIVVAGSMLCLSFIIEILNSLPLLAARFYPVKLAVVAPEIALRLQQSDALKFLAFDVAGFTLVYAGFILYAIVFYRTQKFFAWTVIASVILFIINVPFLWVAPVFAVIFMALSILCCAAVPIIMARLAIG